jgi:hypothetical protein
MRMQQQESLFSHFWTLLWKVQVTMGQSVRFTLAIVAQILTMYFAILGGRPRSSVK